MEKKNRAVKAKKSGLVKALYVLSIVLMVIWVYMIVVNIMYIRNYAASYGMTVSSMMMDSVQYVITGTISYFIYGVLVFCAGKIISLIQNNCSGTCSQPAEYEDNDIPESEDAVEVTEVIEEK